MTQRLLFHSSNRLSYISSLGQLTNYIQHLNQCGQRVRIGSRVKKEEYHGGSFAGNESRKLFKTINHLEAL